MLDRSRLQNDVVGLLSRVKITNLGNNMTTTYLVVSPHETNLREGKISVKSPIGQALVGRKVGDVVDVRVPAGVVRLRIESISL